MTFLLNYFVKKETIPSYKFPISDQAKQIKKYLNFYKKIEQSDNWLYLNFKKELKLGDSSTLIIQAKQVLNLIDNNRNLDKTNTNVFDKELENAIKLFQKSNNLEINGRLNQTTFHVIKKKFNKRIHQLLINSQRWENFKPDSSKPYIFINIATQELLLIKSDSTLINMNIIIGRRDRKTPILNSKIYYVEFNPYWVIPPGIMKKDIIPKLLKDPNYIENNNMKIVIGNTSINQNTINWNDTNVINLYKIIEYPNFKNPMGVVKFEFPNDNYIYLHDTPNKELFLKKPALYSSGCIRIEKATELARYILKNDLNWENKKTDNLIIKGENKKIKLITPLNIYINYFTVWVKTDNSLNFTEDIYNLD
jgi:murein L,D-transpeptidase YcbB/YkuD